MVEQEESKGIDILGIKPIGEAVNTVVKSTVEGATSYLTQVHDCSAKMKFLQFAIY